MILVDTSVWIAWLARSPKATPGEWELAHFAVCGPVLQEVLQGLRPGRESDGFRAAILSLPVLGDPVELATYLAAADLYRVGRSKGYTIRSATDCLIAAIALENDAAVLHRDRDFDALARFTPLRIHGPKGSRPGRAAHPVQ